MVITFSEGLPSVACGERTVMDTEVMGNKLGFGFPASKEMIPGCNSSGKSPLTDQNRVSRAGLWKSWIKPHSDWGAVLWIVQIKSQSKRIEDRRLPPPFAPVHSESRCRQMGSHPSGL